MRALAVGAGLVALAASGVAWSRGASPAVRFVEEPAALVGTYDGGWRWTGCAVAGAERGAVELDYVGGWRIDLTPVHAGVGARDLVEHGAALVHDAADVHVALRATAAGEVTVHVTIGAGCDGQGALRRMATTPPACAGVVALTRVHASCPTASPMPAAAAAASPKAAAATCARLEPTLRRQLIDDGCAPVPLAERPIVVPACQALLGLASTARACQAMPAAAREAVASAAYAVGAQRVPGGSRAAVVDVAARQCDATAARLRAALLQARCR